MSQILVGHQEIFRQLWATHQADRLPSAYLFLGPKGLGKSTVTRVLAQRINCDLGQECGVCENCRLFASGSHPDFLVVGPTGKQIKIAQIQGLIGTLNLKPMYAKKRVVLVKEADKLGLEAANAFLKVLEEPPLDSLLVLTSEDEHGLLETLLSRCQKVSFGPLSRLELAQLLEARTQLEPEAMELVLAYSEGRLRKELIEKAPELLGLEGQVGQLLFRLDPAKLVDQMEWLESLIKQGLEGYFLEFLARWLRDLSFEFSGQSERVRRPAAVALARSQGFEPPVPVLLDAFTQVGETQGAIYAQAGKQLALEGLLLRLHRLLQGALVL